MSEPSHDPPSHPDKESPATAAEDDLLAGLADDFAARVRRREHPTVDEYVAKHPALADRIRKVFEAVALIEQTRSLDPAPAGDRVGSTIGRYKLLEPIGEGGFGVVYMAEQHHPVCRRVALKVVKPGMDSRQVLARFEAERQALAIMDHPNIAKVFDGGMTDSGRPYFVMELVKGEPITEFCDRSQLPPRQRLELFAQVCHAVQHAHTKGVIHRDIKPSNVLVAVYDTTPVVKVIDFGVAKALGQDLTEKTLFTGFAQLIGTPLYMSPEQAGQSALDVDTRSDVYSLGVLLYELLTGTTPFDKDRFRRAAQDEIRRIVREEEPPKPSTRLGMTEGLASISAQRHTDPAKLTKLVRGELDWIVMKALEKDRSRRYETANGFAVDIQRYLADEAVSACPPSAGYKLRKFARKNRKALITAGAFVVLLGAAAVVGTWQAVRATRAEAAANANAVQAGLNAGEAQRNARQARDEADTKAVALAAERRARQDEAKARQQAFAALRSMTGGVIEKKFAQGTVLTEEDRAFLRGVIAQYDAFAAINADDVDSRAGRAEARARVADMRGTLGELKEAEQEYDQALSIYKQLAGEFPDRPEFRQELAITLSNRGRLLRATGRPGSAGPDYDQALSLFTQLVAEAPARSELRHILAKLHGNRGNVLRDIGRLPEAERDYGQALSLQKQLAAEFPSPPRFRQAVAQSHMSRGLLLRDMGRLPEAERDYGQALSIRKQLAADFPAAPEYRQDLAASYNNRGNLVSNAGRLPEAEQDFGEALRLQKQLAADFPTRPEHRQELAKSHINRANLLGSAGRLTEAERDSDQALSLQKQLAEDFPTQPQYRHELAGGHDARGVLLQRAGRLKEAEQEYEQALNMARPLVADFPSQPGLRHDLGRICNNVAILHKLQANWAGAKRLLLEGRPHHLTALAASPRHARYRRAYSNHLNVLTAAHAGLLEPEDAVRTAETCRDLGWDAPADAYDAACLLSRCVPVVARHDKLDDQQRKDAVQFYGDAAMKLLREAVNRGYRDVRYMSEDADLEPLRQRDDFRKLLAQVEAQPNKRTGDAADGPHP